MRLIHKEIFFNFFQPLFLDNIMEKTFEKLLSLSFKDNAILEQKSYCKYAIKYKYQMLASDYREEKRN